MCSFQVVDYYLVLYFRSLKANYGADLAWVHLIFYNSQDCRAVRLALTIFEPSLGKKVS